MQINNEGTQTNYHRLGIIFRYRCIVFYVVQKQVNFSAFWRFVKTNVAIIKLSLILKTIHLNLNIHRISWIFTNISEIIEKLLT